MLRLEQSEKPLFLLSLKRRGKHADGSKFLLIKQFSCFRLAQLIILDLQYFFFDL